MIPKPVAYPSTTSPTIAKTTSATKPSDLNIVSSNPKQAKVETPILNNAASSTSQLSTFSFILDSVYRGIVRTGEVMFPQLRFGRPLTEFVRYFGVGSIEKSIKKEKVTNQVWSSSVRRTLENSLATVLFEPNKFENRGARIFIGFLNNLVRFAARMILVIFEFVNPEDINPSDFLDESLSRTFPRGLYMDTTNPLIGAGVRTVEQLVINSGLRWKPAQKFVEKILPKYPKVV